VSNAALRFTPPKDKKSPEKVSQDKNKIESSVWVLRNNKPQQIEVTTGKSDGVSTAITSSLLQANDKIIIGVEEHL
jgi:hypothetical protein